MIFDSNLHSSHLGLHFGLYENLPVTLNEVLKKRMPIMQAVYIHPTTGVRIIPAPLDGGSLDLTKGKCCSLVNQVKNNYDMVILDCAPGLGKEVLVPMQAVDEAVVISTADIAAVTDAMKTIEILKRFKKNILGMVLNRYAHQKYELTPQEITSTTGYDIIQTIPEDSKIPDSIARGLPAVVSYPYSKASKSVKQLAAFLINEPYKETNLWERFKNVLNFNRFSTSKIEVNPVDNQVMRKESQQKEVSDLTEIKERLVEDAKEELKREIMKKVKKKLKERMYES